MKIAVSVETTVDLTDELKNKYDVHTVPFTITLGDTVKYDDEVTTDEIIDYVTKSQILPKTSAVNEYQFTEHFSSLLKDYDAVIHISLSSEMSSAYANAVSVASKMNNVYVIDSRTLSTGIALLAIYVKELADEGRPAEEVYEMVKARIPRLEVSFVLSRLDYLYKGGRCSSLTYFGANLLKIKPQIVVRNGKMVTGKKYRGKFNMTVKKYVYDVLNEFGTPDLSKVFITYTTCDEETLNDVKSILTDYGFENIMITRAHGTITSHCGEGCLGILYINDGDVFNNK